tara:strand:+ start:345 stop:815 length:471 start_codon:yes stop_codon:yes gene_type:complete
MKKIILLSLLFLFMNSISGQIFKEKYVKDATKVANIWLDKINNKNFSEAYDQYSEKVKVNSDSTYWLKAINQLMIEFGGLKSRELSSSKFENTIEGLGDGFYVFLEFKSLYENISLCDEYVLLGQNDNLKWKILRYDFSYESDELDPEKELPNQGN